jgi:PhoH-like ATPase
MKKIYVVDTNIILEDYENVFTLSDNGENDIYLCDVVLEELDNFKKGVDTINVEARSFNQMLARTKDKSVEPYKEYEEFSDFITQYSDKKKQFTEFHIVRIIDDKLKLQRNDSTRHNYNDLKIIETTKKIKKQYPKIPVILISNDVNMRTIGKSQGIEVERLLHNDFDTEIDFHMTIKTSWDKWFEKDNKNKDNQPKDFKTKIIPIKDVEEQLGLNEKLPKEKSSFTFVHEITNEHAYGFRANGHIELINKSMFENFHILPKNREQEYFSALISSEQVDTIISDSKAGTGKNIMALANAMALIDKYPEKYNQIIYIRQTILSQNSHTQLGYLKGGLEEKLGYFLTPLYKSLSTIAKASLSNNTRFKNLSNTEEEENLKNGLEQVNKEDIEELVAVYEKKYQISTPLVGHLRGDSIPNAIVILDEAQNFRVKDIKTIISRIEGDSKLIVIGSNNQIDDAFLIKSRTALSYLMNETKKDISETYGVRVVGCQLRTVERGKFAEWGDNF